MGGMKVNSCIFVACNHPYMPPQPCPIPFHGPVQMTFTTNSSGITVDLCTAEKLGRGCSACCWPGQGIKAHSCGGRAATRPRVGLN